MGQQPISCVGLCDFRVAGMRRPRHRGVIIDHLYLWLYHNNWDIPKKRLGVFTFRQLIGMLHALADGRGSYMMERLLAEYGYFVTTTSGLIAENRKGVRTVQLPMTGHMPTV